MNELNNMLYPCERLGLNYQNGDKKKKKNYPANAHNSKLTRRLFIFH